jgi:V8-like Glu-specific endopeptidase
VKTLATSIILPALLSTALWAAPSFAGDMSAGSQGNGESPRGGATDQDYVYREAKPIAPKLEAGEESRAAPITDETAIVNSLTAVGKTSDGKDVKVEASDALKAIIKKELNAPADGGDAGKTSAPKKAEDPAFKAGEEASRQVFGSDDRIQIANTKVYPFSAIGYLESKNAKGEYASCSATLIGPSTVLTAAHCLYNHDAGGWQEDMFFVPGLNGSTAADAPFGGYEYDAAYVVQGFIDNYQGYYGSVLPWDLGIITLKQPIGDNLGWLGYNNYDALGDFSANIVGYPGDKPGGTMWRSTCNVLAENIGDGYFQYDCDTYPGSSGSSVYAYDEAAKARIVVGVNVAESSDFNTAVRINAVYLEWINSLNK